jgi:hypothetical protein|tara:strand:- start:305 stop:694 length:390 start_codon:yes stop_codon:yes gene_type:complete
MAAGIYNFTIEQGTTFQRTFKYKDSDGNPLELGNSHVRMQIRNDIADNTGSFLNEFVSGSNTNGGLFILSQSVGSNITDQFTLFISASTTTSMSFDSARYDIEIENTSSGIVTRLLQGKIKLSREVTRT